MLERLARQGVDGVTSTPAQLAQIMRNDYVRYQKLIAESGIKAQ